MALVLCVVCGAAAWAGAWLLLSEEAAIRGVVGARSHMLVHSARRMLSSVSGWGVVRALCSWKAFAQAAEDATRLVPPMERPLSHREVEALLFLLFPLAGILGLLFSRSLVGVFAVPAVLAWMLNMYRVSRSQARTKKVAEEMPGVLRTMATALESGNTLVQAVEYVGLHEKGPAAESFARASLRLRCGMSVDTALYELANELDAPGIDLLTTALAISQRTGSPLRDLLRRSAALVEQHGEFERLLAVRTAQVRLSVRIVCSLPVLMVCLLTLILPDFRQGLATTPGMVCLCLAGAMDGIALLLIKRIMGRVL